MISSLPICFLDGYNIQNFAQKTLNIELFCYSEIQNCSQQLPFISKLEKMGTLILITIFGRYKLIIHLFFVELSSEPPRRLDTFL